MNKAKNSPHITKMELGSTAKIPCLQQHILIRKISGVIWLPGTAVTFWGSLDGSTFVVPDLIVKSEPLRDIKAFYQLRRVIKKIQAAPPATARDCPHHSPKAGILGGGQARVSGIYLMSIYSWIRFHDYQPRWLEVCFFFLEKLTRVSPQGLFAGFQSKSWKKVFLSLFPPGRYPDPQRDWDLSSFRSPQVSRAKMKEHCYSRSGSGSIMICLL